MQWVNGGKDVFITKDDVPSWMATESKMEREFRSEFKETFGILTLFRLIAKSLMTSGRMSS